MSQPDRLTQERVAKNEDAFRKANEKIADAADRLTAEQQSVPFICECADPACTEILSLTVADYRSVRSDPTWFVNAPGHEAAALGAAKVVEDRGSYLVVEKIGHAGEVAADLTATGEAHVG